MSSRLFAAALLCGVLLSSCRSTDTPSAAAGPRGADNASPAKQATLVPAEEGRLAETILVTGTLAAQDQVTASAKVAGRVDSVDVDFGSLVSKGQVLARLDPRDFRLRVDQAGAALKQARARLGLNPDGEDEEVIPEKAPLVREARAQLEDAKLNGQRTQALWDKGVIPKSQLDSVESSLKVAESRYDDALDEIRDRHSLFLQRKSELESAKQQLADTVLYAPVDGVVRERLVSPGNYAAAGSPMFNVVIVNPLRMRLAVPERGASGAKLGAPVRVTVEGDSNVYTGKLVRVSPSIQEQNRTLLVEAEIPNEQGALRPGTFARAEIVTSAAKPVVFVPASSITSFAGIEKVFTVNEGKALEIRVKTGRRDGSRVEIVEGIKAGLPVVVEPGSLVPGDSVIIK